MMTPPQIVLAVGGGYLLGRTRKLRFAIVVGGAITGRRLPTSATDLARLGARVVAASPEFARLRDAVCGQLLTVGRGAAIAAATHHMEVLTGRLTTHLEPVGTSPTALRAGPLPGSAAGERRMVVEPVTGALPETVPATIEVEHPTRSRGESRDHGRGEVATIQGASA